MRLSDIPQKFAMVWAAAAGAGTIHAIPDASQIGTTDGAASLTDGFPPLNAVPRASGGIPPDIKDFNGILQRLSAWAIWVQNGGPIRFDPAYVAENGGYPAGATLQSRYGVGVQFVSTADDNTSDPDSLGTVNWVTLGGTHAAGVTGGIGYERRASGVLEMWGTVYQPTGSAEPAITVTMPFDYTDTTFVVVASPYIVAPSNARDSWIDVVAPLDTRTFQIQYQYDGVSGRPGLDGFKWRSIGMGA